MLSAVVLFASFINKHPCSIKDVDLQTHYAKPLGLLMSNLLKMSALSGIFSLQEAMNTTATAAYSSINPTKLHLGELKSLQQVRNAADHLYPKFHQPLLYDGTKLCLQTPAVHLDKLYYNKHQIGYSLYVPVTPWLRQQLSLIDAYVDKNVTINSELLQAWPEKRLSYYKPFYHGEKLYMLLGNYCKFTEATSESDYKIIQSPPLPDLGSGLYSFHIEIPQVYIGPHKDGNLISVNLRIVRVHYQPDNHFQELLKSCTELSEKVIGPIKIKRRRCKKENDSSSS